MKLSRKVGLHVIGPVICGSVIYVLFRSPELLVFDWFADAHLLGFVIRLRSHSEIIAAALPSWLLFSVPDGLWVYGVTAAMVLIWTAGTSFESVLWVSSGLMLAAAGEFGQAAGVVPGTFDLVDLFMISIGFSLGSTLPTREERNDGSPFKAPRFDSCFDHFHRSGTR